MNDKRTYGMYALAAAIVVSSHLGSLPLPSSMRSNSSWVDAMPGGAAPGPGRD
jgi:hypothetical protein